ncbi:uncharacterized protein Fot_01581 [Forsythia ovata]|uniref:DUF4283 domain-containing protein n=1 Tax=Forsythia ovata TaxID=205694 RepID=A0ABD1X4C9_9LAMI
MRLESLGWQLNPQTLVLGKLKLYAVVWVDPNAKLYAVVWVDLIGFAKLPLQEVVDDVRFGSLLEKKLELKRPSGRPHGKLEVNGSVREPRYRVPDPYYAPYGVPTVRPPTVNQPSGYPYGAPSYGQPGYGQPSYGQGGYNGQPGYVVEEKNNNKFSGMGTAGQDWL